MLLLNQLPTCDEARVNVFGFFLILFAFKLQFISDRPTEIIRICLTSKAINSSISCTLKLSFQFLMQLNTAIQAVTNIYLEIPYQNKLHTYLDFS